MLRRRWRQVTSTGDRLTGFAMLAAALSRHALRRRRVYSLGQRLSMMPDHGLPLGQAVVIHWNDHQIPYIEADTDHDLAVALGLVHAHLRLAQIELMRRLAQGRMSEMIGRI